jgi:CBS domain-containing protein
MVTVKQVLEGKVQRSVRGVAPSDSVQTVLELMQAHTIRSVVVLEQDSLIGIVSERDCALKVLLKDAKAADITARDIMTADVITVSEDNSIDECMREMTSKNIRHLPVCRGRTVIGMVSVGDVVKEVIRQQTEHIGYLESYIKGHGVPSY